MHNKTGTPGLGGPDDAVWNQADQQLEMIKAHLGWGIRTKKYHSCLTPTTINYEQVPVFVSK